MIKATELRSGNYLQGKILSPAHAGIYKITAHDINNIENGSGGLHAIPLTEEWLKKLGFFKYNNAWVLKKPENNMKFGFSVWYDLTYNTGELSPPLNYVHQLQNLYFALTGKELHIKKSIKRKK